MVDSFLQRVWYARHAPWLSLLMLPLSWLFGALVTLRRASYRLGLLRPVRVARPVVVIGNITVGGTGKTPFTIWLAKQLEARGLRVGIILRGYRGQSTQWPRDVTPGTPWEEVGDEAVLIAERTAAIVVAGPDRVADANRAIEQGADVVLSDDGLQHYRLARDAEIAILDERRGLGNGRLLPAGPLREGRKRLAEVDLKVLTRRAGNGSYMADAAAIVAVPRLLEAVSITTGEHRPLQSFAGVRLHAIAGIGHPQAFFDALSALNLQVQGHALPDHAHLRAEDISFADQAPVLMTEKDAVKCRAIADHRHWAVRMDIEVNERDAARVAALAARLAERRAGIPSTSTC